MLILLAIIVYIISTIICVYDLYYKYMTDQAYSGRDFSYYICAHDYECRFIWSYIPAVNTFLCFMIGIYFLCKYLYNTSHQ